MNDDIIRMAKEAWGESHEIFWFNDGGIERFAALIRADERKRSAEAAYEFLDDPFLSGHGYATGCRDAILAGSET